LKEELGINIPVLNKITKFYVEQKFEDIVLREFSVLYSTIFDGDITLDREELSGGKWFSLGKVEEMLKDNPNEFPPGFVEAFKRYKKVIK